MSQCNRSSAAFIFVPFFSLITASAPFAMSPRPPAWISLGYPLRACMRAVAAARTALSGAALAVLAAVAARGAFFHPPDAIGAVLRDVPYFPLCMYSTLK